MRADVSNLELQQNLEQESCCHLPPSATWRWRSSCWGGPPLPSPSQVALGGRYPGDPLAPGGFRLNPGALLDPPQQAEPLETTDKEVSDGTEAAGQTDRCEARCVAVTRSVKTQLREGKVPNAIIFHEESFLKPKDIKLWIDFCSTSVFTFQK